MGSVALQVSSQQLDRARLEHLPGLSAHVMLSRGMAPDSRYAPLVKSKLSQRSQDAVSVMNDRGGSFCPTFAIPTRLPSSRHVDESERLVDADTGSLERLLAAVYPAGIPDRWNRVLDDPRAWLIALADAYASVRTEIAALWARSQARLTAEAIRFEISRESELSARAFVSSCHPFRLDESAIVMPWLGNVSRSFSGQLTFAPLITERGSRLLLLHDREGIRDVDATIAFGMRASRRRGRVDVRNGRIELVLGRPRAAILAQTNRPQSMGELSSTLNFAPATITYHVQLLASAGLVTVERHDGFSWVTRTTRAELLLEVLA